MPTQKPSENSPKLDLRYVGPGDLTGIPARDLSAADLTRLASDPYVQRRLAKNPKALAELLVSTALYAPARPEKES